MDLNDPAIKDVVDDLVEREWFFFHTVNNPGGPAACQSMPNTFSAARRAQYATWTPEAVRSWHDDLVAYGERGENPLSFKYGYMMATTHPDEYEQIKDMLPTVPDEALPLIDELVRYECGWAEELAEHYPHYAGKSRPVHSTSDSESWTSTETYARAEFSTYSMRTLRLVLDLYRRAAERGENLYEASAAAQAKAFGYQSLAAADKVIAENRMSDQGLDGKVRSFSCGGGSSCQG